MDLVDEQQADAASERVAGGGNAPRRERISSFSGVVKRMVVCASLLRLLYVCRGGGDYAADGVRVAGDFLA